MTWPPEDAAVGLDLKARIGVHGPGFGGSMEFDTI
jgi:hypothetical protein